MKPKSGKLEQTFRHSEDLYRLLADNISDVIFILDMNLRYTYCSPSVQQLRGYSVEETMAQTLDQALTPASYQLVKKTLDDELARAKLEPTTPRHPRTLELELTRKQGGTVWAEVKVSFLRDRKGSPARILGVSRNITARRLAEEEIRRLNRELELRVTERTAELEAANRELEAFSYSVSHDLMVPLLAIEGFARLLAKRDADRLQGKGTAYVDIILENARRMQQLISGLLAFSRLSHESVEPMAIDMFQVTESVVREIRETSQGRTLQFTCNPLPACHGDQMMIRQVIVNLLSNAVKFTKPRDTAYIEVGGWPEEEHNVYYIKDNGVGFDMQYATRLFKVFERLHSGEEFPGTGIGLSIVERIVARHGGKVWAEGKIDGGATFYFTLPRAAAIEAVAQ